MHSLVRRDSERFARIGLDVPLARTFDYRIPPHIHDIAVGERVLVPFGKRRLVGVVLEVNVAPEVPPEQCRPIERALDDAAPLAEEDLRLLRFAADYYHYPIGQVVAGTLPQHLRRLPARTAAALSVRITPTGLAVDPASLPPRAKRQRALLHRLHCERVLTPERLRSIGEGMGAALRVLQKKGWVELIEEAATFPPTTLQPAVGPELTSSQARALAAVVEHLHHFQAVLLLGVTGSGKTEVYLRAAEVVLQRGGQVLLLVPEIALTPQLLETVRHRFPGTQIATLHSALTDAERALNWQAAQSAAARVLVGTRLAVFAPLPRLGLIIVDEEHDASFKQTEGFCYSARDLAVVRAQQRSVPVVLGSATPSLESYHNASSGRYRLVELPERINGRPPRIACVALHPLRARATLAPQLVEAIAERLRRGEQTLVFINRRGYAPVLMCHECGWLSGCHRCSAQLVLHLAARQLCCHHCGYQTAVPANCPSCGNPALSPVGQGTQRVEETLTRAFPQARILRIDRDTTRRRHAFAEMRDRIGARDVDILVGTQILAKGHDFPHLALVGVLNADSMLYSADFRAAERLYALLTQVAGRAGRGASAGEVLIQTAFPEHPLYRALCDQDVHRFASQLLAERGSSGFPPYVHQALLRAEAPRLDDALAFLEHARRIAEGLSASVELFDAVPATMVRLAGRERAQLLVQSAARPALHGFLREWRSRLAQAAPSRARWALEVDPLDL